MIGCFGSILWIMYAKTRWRKYAIFAGVYIWRCFKTLIENQLQDVRCDFETRIRRVWNRMENFSDLGEVLKWRDWLSSMLHFELWSINCIRSTFATWLDLSTLSRHRVHYGTLRKRILRTKCGTLPRLGTADHREESVKVHHARGSILSKEGAG